MCLVLFDVFDVFDWCVGVLDVCVFLCVFVVGVFVYCVCDSTVLE